VRELYKGVIMSGNSEKLTNLVGNYDDMTEEGKKELLLIGEKYLNEKDRIENKKENFENKL
jgi:hypothetical protein